MILRYIYYMYIYIYIFILKYIFMIFKHIEDNIILGINNYQEYFISYLMLSC